MKKAHLLHLEEEIKENIVNEKEEDYIGCAGNSVSLNLHGQRGRYCVRSAPV